MRILRLLLFLFLIVLSFGQLVQIPFYSSQYHVYLYDILAGTIISVWIYITIKNNGLRTSPVFRALLIFILVSLISLALNFTRYLFADLASGSLSLFRFIT